MASRDDEQLVVQFDGDGATVEASGVWETIFSRRELLFGASVVAGAAMLGQTRAARAASTGLLQGAPGRGKTIGVSFAGLNEYVYNDLTGVLSVLRGTQYKLIVRQASFTASKQLSDVEDLLAQDPDALNVLPSTVQATSNAVLKAKAQGVPCVNQFWSGKTPGDSAYIGVLMTDNLIGGKLVTNYIEKNVPEGGKILIVMGNVGQGYSEQFTKGIERSLGSKWTIADVQPGNYVRSTSIDAAQTMLTAHPDAKVIVSYAAEMGVAVARYLKQTGRDEILHITSDSNHEMIRWMKSGEIAANRYLSASQTGVLTTRMLRTFLEQGKRPAKFVTRQPQRMITAANFAPKNPPPGVVNKKLSNDPSFGVYSYENLLSRAKSLVS